MQDVEEILSQFSERNGLSFKDRSLLRTALTHRSYLNEHGDVDWEDNERLEYLGDAAARRARASRNAVAAGIPS